MRVRYVGGQRKSDGTRRPQAHCITCIEPLIGARRLRLGWVVVRVYEFAEVTAHLRLLNVAWKDRQTRHRLCR